MPANLIKTVTNNPDFKSCSLALNEKIKLIQLWIAIIGYKGVDGNNWGNSTPSNFYMAKGCLTVPFSSSNK